METKKFSDFDIYDFGNNLEISGIMIGNGERIILFPFDELPDKEFTIVDMAKEDWDKLLFQLDMSEVVINPTNDKERLQKIIVRKSQRQIDTKIQWKVFKRDNYMCQYCGKDDVPLTIDHIVLWEDLGQSVEDNLITSCRKCNKTRGNMKMEDWLGSNYYLERMPSKEINDKIILMNTKAQKLPRRPHKRNR